MVQHRGESGERGRRWAALAVVCLAALIINVDNTILNVALPTLVRDLHATSSQLQWIVDSYSMVFAGLLLVSGSLADRFGRQKFFLLGLAVFGTGSIAAAFSGSVALLVPSRAVMGARRGPDDPVVAVHRQRRLPRPETAGKSHRRLGRDHRPRDRHRPHRRRPAAGAASGGGPSSSSTSPIVIAALIGTLVLVPDSKNPAAERPDPVGAVLSIAGLGLLLWAIIEAPTQGWASTGVDRGRRRQPRRARRLRRLGGPQPPPDAEAGLLRRPPVLGRRRGRVPRGLRACWGLCSCRPSSSSSTSAIRPSRPGCASCPWPPCSW